MTNLLMLLTGLAVISFNSSAAENGAPASAEWTPLLDANLSRSEKYIGVPDVSVAPPLANVSNSKRKAMSVRRVKNKIAG